MTERRWIDDGYVDDSYVDDIGGTHRVPERTVDTLAAIIGQPAPDIPDRSPLVVGQGWRPTVNGVVDLEDGTERVLTAGQVADLPLGYHLASTGSTSRSLIVAPGRCRQPAGRGWGIAVQLYAARSRASWGIGDLRDLATIRRAAGRHGASFVLVNPLHAAAPVDAQESCPYAPVSRFFGNPVNLSIADVPGAAVTDLSDLAGAVADTNRSAWLDRDRVWQLKREALRRIRQARAAEAEFAAWRDLQPPELRWFAVWCALSERFGASTTTWPAAYRARDGAGVTAFAAGAADRVDFHTWLQWLLARQLAAFGAGVVHDLAVGVTPGGADPWIWPDAFVHGATIGAPPDALNTRGQDWGMAPLHPWRLRADGYAPFVRLVRAALTGSAGIRIDHILGLFRLWLVPRGAGPDEGAYVRYPADDLLAVLRLESHRAGAPVIGEDLGTVEEGVRDRLAESGVLTCRVLLFDPHTTRNWPAAALASTTTHDLPTIAGLWTGTDLADQRSAGVAAEAETARLRANLAASTGLDTDSTAQAVDAAHHLIGASPCVLAAVGLEDLLGLEHRPNIPATDRPENWNRPLPVPIDDLDAVLATAAAALARPAVAPATDPFTVAGAT